MLDLITEIIRLFGGRPSGSQQELKAQRHFKKRLGEFCNSVEEHHFSAALKGHFGSLKFFVPLFWVCLGLYWCSIPLATAACLITTILFFGHFITYGDWLDFLFKKQPSINIIGTLEPQEEVKSTIIISGHMDSVYEFRWWYLLKKSGGIFTVVACALFPLTMLFLVIVLMCSQYGYLNVSYANLCWGILATLTPTQLILLTMHGKKVVDGATDNLSGVAVTWGTGQHFYSGKKGQSNLKNTRLKLISFGCEEAGLKGAQAYVRDHLNELKNETTMLLNIDSIKNRKHMTILHAELNTLAFYKKEVYERTKSSFDACNIPTKKVALTVGASDASAFAWKGIPSICVIGLPSSYLDPIYHTRLDNLENIDPDGMEACKEALVHFITRWDAEQPQL